jgi:hypothetical protein
MIDMAKAKMVNAIALVNLKYDKNCFKIGEKLKVRASEVEAMEGKRYIEVLDEDGDGEGTEETSKEETGESLNEGE